MAMAQALADTAEPFVMTRTWTALIASSIFVLVLGVHFIVRRGARGPTNPRTSQDTLAFRRQGLKALVIGSDGRASTSKVQAMLWTAALLYVLVFLLLFGRTNGCDDRASAQKPLCLAAADARGTFDDVTRRAIQPEIYVLLGLPLAAALTAKAVNTQKQSDGTLDKDIVDPGRRGVITGFGEVMSNDEGQADLVDFQYFAFNLLALTFFLTEFFLHPTQGIPTIPRTLLALSGLSVGTYTAKKALEQKPPKDSEDR